MEYRKTKQGDAISTIGVGCSHFHEISPKEMDSLIGFAIEQGINLLDSAMSYLEPFSILGSVLKSRRDKLLYQMHLGLTFPDSQYVRTRKINEVQKAFEEQLRLLGTDYTDIAFIHCVDESEDYEQVFASGIYDYAKKLKQEGKARYIGFASHTIGICHRFLQDADFDFCMLSINPAYDLDPVNNIPFDGLDMTGQDQLAVSKDRFAFYKECEKHNISIQVMKPYGGGILLNAETSPFERAMSVPQCLQYALDRPAVLSCLLGVRGKQELQDAISYYTASKEERDYSFVAGLQHKDMRGACVYCNHCLPCPADIDIGAVQKYLDLTLAGDQLAKEHYLSLSKRASDCIQCGSCEKNCPFHVEVRAKMEQAARVMEAPST